MNRLYPIIFILFLCIANGGAAQQLPLSTYQLVLFDPLNPSQVRAGNLNGVYFAIQQRTRQGSGWRSASQFLNFHGRPQGRTGHTCPVKTH